MEFEVPACCYRVQSLIPIFHSCNYTSKYPKSLFQLVLRATAAHVLEPVWATDEAFTCSKKLLHSSTEPRNITHRCPCPCDFPVQLLDSRSSKYDVFLQYIDGIIIAKFSYTLSSKLSWTFPGCTSHLKLRSNLTHVGSYPQTLFSWFLRPRNLWTF